MNRMIFLGMCLATVGAYVVVGGAIYAANSTTVGHYRAVSATNLGTDASSSSYAYTYRVGDRLCRGSSISEPYPTDSPTVYYDTKDVCSSVTTDPAGARTGYLLIWLFPGVYVAAMAIVWRLTTPRPGGVTWQAS